MNILTNQFPQYWLVQTDMRIIQIQNDTMNPTDNSTNYHPDIKSTNISPANGNSISSDILIFPHTKAIQYSPTQNQYNTVYTKPFKNFTFANKLKTCSQRTNTITKIDITHRHTIPGSSKRDA